MFIYLGVSGVLVLYFYVFGIITLFSFYLVIFMEYYHKVFWFRFIISLIKQYLDTGYFLPGREMFIIRKFSIQSKLFSNLFFMNSNSGPFDFTF